MRTKITPKRTKSSVIERRKPTKRRRSGSQEPAVGQQRPGPPPLQELFEIFLKSFPCANIRAKVESSLRKEIINLIELHKNMTFGDWPIYQDFINGKSNLSLADLGQLLHLKTPSKSDYFKEAEKVVWVESIKVLKNEK